MSSKIIHDKKYQQFSIAFGEEEAELAYATPEPGVLDFTHIFIPEANRGSDVAQKLIEEGINYAKQNNCKIIATCPAVAAYFKRHPEQQELLK